MLFTSWKVFREIVIFDISLEESPNPPWNRGITFVASHAEGGVLDISQSETSRICQRPVEMVITRGWNVWWCDRKRNTIPYVLMPEIFRNGIGLLIFWDKPFEIYPIWLWIYMRNVNMDHCPILIMVVSLSSMDLQGHGPSCSQRMNSNQVWVDS